MPGEHDSDDRPPGARAAPASPPPPGDLRTDVRRALRVLAEGRWVRADLPARGRGRAAVQLSKYKDDLIPLGVDVLGVLRGAGWVVEGRRLPGGQRRFVLTPAGRAALGGAPDPAGATNPEPRPWR